MSDSFNFQIPHSSDPKLIVSFATEGEPWRRSVGPYKNAG